MKTKFLAVVLVALALAIAFAARATQQINDSKAALASLAPQCAALRGRIVQLEQRLNAANDGRKQTGPKSATTSGERRGTGAANATTGTTVPAKSKATGARLSPETIIANDPKKMAEYSRNFRDSLDLTYGGMFKALHLSPEQMEKFKDLKVAQEQRRMDLLAAAETQGLDQQNDDYSLLEGRLYKESRNQEADLLGSGPTADQYLEYRNLSYLRDTTKRLASSEVYPDVPIAAAQVERVTEVVASNSERPPGSPWSWQYWSTINWDAVGTQLQGVLSPSQLATLRLFVRPGESQAAVNNRYFELQAEAKKISRQPGS